MLNLARRRPEQIAIRKARYDTQGRSVSSSMLYRKIEGRTPKVTMSASESSSFPIGELTLSILAANPSRKSNTHAAATNQNVYRGVSNTIAIPRTPHNRLQHVSAFG